MIAALLLAIHVALAPAQQTAAPGDTLAVVVRVTEQGAPFNAYQALVQFDPTRLAFVASEEGPYMTDACGATFHWFTAGTRELGVVHSLLCAGLSLPGPGDVYTLRFRALAPGTAAVVFGMIEFADAGNPVTPVHAVGATVVVTVPTDIGMPPGRVVWTWAAVRRLWR